MPSLICSKQTIRTYLTGKLIFSLSKNGSHISKDPVNKLTNNYFQAALKGILSNLTRPFSTK